MKKILLVALGVLFLSPIVLAGDKKKKNKSKKAATVDTVINWIPIHEVEAALKKNPKKIFIDVYTDWCGWCKVMDKKTFSNKDVAMYMNENYYAIKFNAERKDSITFMGKTYGFVPQYRSNQLAAELMGGRMSYPTFVILDETAQNPIPVPGYQNVPTMEKILKYIATNTYKTVQFPEYEKTFVATWKDAPEVKPAAPVVGGH